MEQEVRELLEARYQQKSDLINAIKNSWKELPETPAKNKYLWTSITSPIILDE